MLQSRAIMGTAVACVVMMPLGRLSAQTEAMRHGFWFSGGLGYGSLGCDNCDGRTGGFSGGLSLAGTISSPVQLGVGTTGWTRSEDGAIPTVGTLDARVRVYPSSHGGFFFTGGLGVGTISASVAGLGSGSENGTAVLLESALTCGWGVRHTLVPSGTASRCALPITTTRT